MSVLINLLPDTRLQKQRYGRRRQIFTTIVLSVWGFCIVSVVIMIATVATQKAIISSDTNKIENMMTELRKNESELVASLTTQQHLLSLPALYENRSYMNKFFEVYAQANPVGMTLSSLNLEDTNTLVVTGIAQDYKTVSQLAESLKASKDTAGKSNFESVTIKSVGRDDGNVNFSIESAVDKGVNNGKN